MILKMMLELPIALTLDMEKKLENELNKIREMMTIFVVSCDAYTPLARTFFDLKEKYMSWFDGHVLLINESEPFERDGVEVFHAGASHDWSARVLLALDQVQTPYVLFMLEDYFIGKPVEMANISEALKYMEESGCRYYKITNTPHLNGTVKGHEHLSPIGSNIRYGINLQAAIFSTQFLKEIVDGEDRSAWAVETDLLDSVTDSFEGNLSDCVVDKRNIIDVHNGVIKGRWMPHTIEYFLKKGYVVDLGDRPIMKKSEIRLIMARRFVAHSLPAGFVKKLKPVLSLLGIKFVTTK